MNFSFIKASAFASLCCLLLLSSEVKAQFQLNGSAASLGSDCYKLNNAIAFSSGSMWNLDQIDLNNDFVFDIEVYLGCNDGNGADGMVFGLQTVSTTVGSSGGGLGFSGISPSIGVEFDTYQNSDWGDPSFDHVAIVKNGVLNHTITANTLAGPIQASPTSINIENCAYHTVTITWNATAHELKVYWECQLRLTLTQDIMNTIFGGDNMVYWGVTASTGSLINEHRVCFNEITFSDPQADVALCLGDSTTLQAIAPDAVNIVWTPSTGLSSDTIANPVATPSETTTYLVACQLGCNAFAYDTVVVTVNGLASPLEMVENIVVCPGESYEIGNSTYDIAGSYVDTLTTAGGCDSLIVNTVLSILPAIVTNQSLFLCAGEIVVVGNTTYNFSGNFTNVLSAANGCDSTVNTALVVAAPIITQQAFALCFGSEFEVGNSIYTATGNYADSLIAANGCDSLVITELTIWPPAITNQTLETCFGQSVSVGNSEYNISGDYVDTLINGVGCDSIIFTSVNIIETVENSQTLFICPGQSVWVGSSDYMLAGDYIDTLVSAIGCDSIVFTTVATADSSLTIEEVYLCPGDTLWLSQGVFTQSGVFETVFVNQFGCDSLIRTLINTIPFDACELIHFPHYIPNAFSPNDDNVNDIFGVFVGDGVEVALLRVFDRWGTLVFESNQNTLVWDGSFRDQKLDMGVFSYYTLLIGTNNEVLFKEGSVTLVR
jgi:gliding motility-associated-like protein